MTWSRGNSFHTCGEKMPKCVRASAAVSGPEWPARMGRTPVRNLLSWFCWLQTRARRLAGPAEQRDLELLFLARDRIPHGERLRLLREIGDLEPVVHERVVLHVDTERDLVRYRVADLDQAIGQPVPEATALEHGHDDVEVRLELDEPLPRVGHRSLADPLELDTVMRLEGARQGDEVFQVHLHPVRMARVAHH